MTQSFSSKLSMSFTSILCPALEYGARTESGYDCYCSRLKCTKVGELMPLRVSRNLESWKQMGVEVSSIINSSYVNGNLK
jgi:hypothetical protein